MYVRRHMRKIKSINNFVSFLGASVYLSCTIACSFISETGFAGTTGETIQSNSKYRPFLSLYGGVAAASNAGRTQTLAMEGDFTTYQYFANKSDSNTILWGGTLGTEVTLNSKWDLQLGVSFYKPEDISSSGVLVQGVDPQSADSFNYSYHLKSSQLLIEGKILRVFNKIYWPYLSLGLGATFNKASNYQTNVPPFLTFTPNFADHKVTHFAYSLGTGIDVSIQENIRLGIGYRYVDLNKANLGSGVIDTTPIPQTLAQSNIHMHQALIQISYIV